MKKYIFLFTILIASCNKQQTKNSENDIPVHLKSNYFTLEEVLAYKHDAIANGNEDSYAHLCLYYMHNKEKYYELLPISIIVADKYKMNSSFIEVYKSIIMIKNNGVYKDEFFSNLDLPSKELALHYLNIGVKESCPGCLGTFELLNRQGYGMSINIIKADSLKKVFIERFNFPPNSKVR